VENFYTDLQNQINKQYNLLNMLCGNSESITISDTTIIDKGFDIETDSIFAMAVVNNPDIKIANDNIESARLDLVSTSRDQLPSLNMLAGTGYRNGFMPDVFTTRFNYYVGVSLNIPIFSSSRPGYQRKIALVNLNASRSALETQQITLNKDILNALEDVKKNKNKLAGSDTLIMQATLALRLATDRYKNGVITTLELLTAQTNYQDALLSRLQYEYNLLLAKMEINRLTGKRWW
jgi:outer membrane protein TolC